MNLYLALPLLTGVALVQTTLLAQVNVLGARPNLMLLLVLVWAVVRGMDEGLIWAFVGGLILDLLSGGPLPSLGLALLAGAYLAGQSLGQGVGSQAVRLIILTMMGATAYHLVLLIILDWSGHTVDWGFSLLRVAGPSVLLNAGLAPILLPLLTWLDQATGERGPAL